MGEVLPPSDITNNAYSPLVASLLAGGYLSGTRRFTLSACQRRGGGNGLRDRGGHGVSSEGGVGRGDKSKDLLFVCKFHAWPFFVLPIVKCRASTPLPRSHVGLVRQLPFVPHYNINDLRASLLQVALNPSQDRGPLVPVPSSEG